MAYVILRYTFLYILMQVIQEALSVWDLELIPWRSEEAADARDHPE